MKKIIISVLSIIILLNCSTKYPPDVAEYLKPEVYTNSNGPLIINTANRLVKNESDEIQKAKILFEFVRDSIDEGNFDSYKASEVLKAGNGFCYNKAILLSALCRAAGIPARLTFDEVKADSVPSLHTENIINAKFLHGITEIYLNGKWIKYDQTGNAKRWNLWNRIWLKENLPKIDLPLEFSTQHDVVFPSVGKLIVTRTNYNFFDWSKEIEIFTEEFNLY